MAEHKFGGDWTEVKLGKLEKYLKAYRTLFSGNEKARYFKTWYVDAFAGTGSRTTADAVPDPNALLFAVDVYEEEPVSVDHPFLAMPNVLCTPHSAWAEWDNFELYFREAYEQIVAFEKGLPLRLANPAVKPRREAGAPPAG